jgi:formate-dependent nitrite reductase membrane component NrfD
MIAWALFLFAIASFGLLVVNLYRRAASGPPLTVQAVAAAAGFVAPLVLAVVLIAVLLHREEMWEAADGLF